MIDNTGLTPCWRIKVATAFVVTSWMSVAGCGRPDDLAGIDHPHSTLTIGYGLATSGRLGAAVQETARNVAVEGLLIFSGDGRPQPRLVDEWSLSPDGLVLRLHLRPGGKFHDGQAVTAAVVRDSLIRDLGDFLGPVRDDIESIRTSGDYEIEIALKRRSALLLEGLEIRIQKPGTVPIGTGPFSVTASSGEQVELRANEDYYGGRPAIDQILIKPYTSIRAAWADMLRGKVDMVYELGVDALDLIEPSNDIRVYSFQRPYIYTVILNVARPHLRDSAFRRALNASVDRETLVKDGLRGHATVADSPVSQSHWAFDPTAPRFEYRPRAIAGRRHEMKLLVTEPSHERVALLLQRQLQDVGVDVELEQAPLDKAMARVIAGDFDAWLADAIHGPTVIRPYWFWHSRGPFNWGHYRSPRVDAALDAIRHSADEEAYKAGVAAFQRAIFDDPPAIFLAWSERARAVSARFEVPVEPGLDVLRTLRLWRPVGYNRGADSN